MAPKPKCGPFTYKRGREVSAISGIMAHTAQSAKTSIAVISRVVNEHSHSVNFKPTGAPD